MAYRRLGRLRLMRILFATDEFPWPVRGGYQMRMAQILETLAMTGETDLVVAVGERRSSNRIPSDAPVTRSIVVEHRRVRGGRLNVAVRWATGRSPKTLLRTDWSEPRRELRGWLRPPYDIAWFSHSAAYLELGHLVDAPALVDLDNLNSARMEHRRLADVSMPTSRHLPGEGMLARRLTRLSDLLDEGRWKEVDARVAAEASVVLVCSELDRRRLGARNAIVLPNGYELPAAATPDTADCAAPVVVMVGRLAYAPNLDGAYYFVDHVWPKIRQQAPDAQLRLVGRYRRESDVAWLQSQPGVIVVGEVDDLEQELRSAKIAVVPLRYGGGTRIKVLEAFAHGIPVVSTSIGCEGLEAVDGRHLLVADKPQEFAGACVRLLQDAELRRALTAAAHELYTARYAWDVIRPQVAALVSEVARAQGTPPSAERSNSLTPGRERS